MIIFLRKLLKLFKKKASTLNRIGQSIIAKTLKDIQKSINLKQKVLLLKLTFNLLVQISTHFE